MVDPDALRAAAAEAQRRAALVRDPREARELRREARWLRAQAAEMEHDRRALAGGELRGAIRDGANLYEPGPR